MKIRELYNACGNTTPETQMRVKPVIDPHKTIFQGPYYEMELEMKEMHVVVFEFDNDMRGLLIIVSERGEG